MKSYQKLFKLGVAAAVSMMTGTAFAAPTGLSNSPHDLASGVTTAADKNEICVYCHTPHGGRTDVVAPLWNKPDTGSSYTTYDSTTIDGSVLAVGSVSLVCLTCHDGTQARDTVINAPGTGLNGGAMGALGTIAGAPNATVSNLGTDLSNDHPIGIQYGGFDPGTGVIDPDFQQLGGTNPRLETNAAAGSAQRWWVDTGAVNGTREKTDMILYTRETGPSSGAFNPYVECGSCHDPHVADTDDTGGTGTNIVGSNISFMRIPNTNSDVCLACHVK